ncbi:1-aminocyclopropane-1-carboxylate deaminase [Anopheles sinensis]|uniref:1-aminocyclopropane-1-carboxylate deaminase n=1 Tax=Anopheles sinensis TaxID=74873 RepID=A0A084W0W2_ANOSI|nr:1-aminocyclopropane-1-carboxylate deaminase [Anopheles sinensis]
MHLTRLAAISFRTTENTTPQTLASVSSLRASTSFFLLPRFFFTFGDSRWGKAGTGGRAGSCMYAVIGPSLGDVWSMKKRNIAIKYDFYAFFLTRSRTSADPPPPPRLNGSTSSNCPKVFLILSLAASGRCFDRKANPREHGKEPNRTARQQEERNAKKRLERCDACGCVCLECIRNSVAGKLVVPLVMEFWTTSEHGTPWLDAKKGKLICKTKVGVLRGLICWPPVLGSRTVL